MSELDLETVVRQLVTAAAANHGDGKLGYTTVNGAQFPVLAETRAVGARLGELGVGYEIGTLHLGGGVYVSVANDRRAQEALQRNWTAVGPRKRPAGGRSPSADRPEKPVPQEAGPPALTGRRPVPQEAVPQGRRGAG